MAVIYALEDPRDGELRYIGYTCKSPQRRWNEHFYDATKTAKSHRYDWLRSLRREGFKPRGRVIVECSEKEAPLLERVCIAVYRALGFRLVNGSDGGEGVRGQVLTPEMRARMAAAARGNKNSLGHRHTEGSRLKMSESQRARVLSGGFVPSRKGSVVSEETRAKMAASHRRRYQENPDLRARLSEVMKSQWVNGTLGRKDDS